jgi:hypothetical protein
VGERAAGFLGFTAAPTYISRSWEQQRAIEQGRRYLPTPLEKKRLQERRSQGVNVPSAAPRSNGLRTRP